jgi:hypothetical protein
LLDQYFRLAPRHKPFPVQTFITQLAVEAFHESILPRAAWFDIGWPNVLVSQPFHHCSCSKFPSII